jgi:hypothetical protein
VTAWVIVTELALHQCAPGVEPLPSKHIDGTGERAESVHGARDGENTGCKDDYNTMIVSMGRFLV